LQPTRDALALRISFQQNYTQHIFDGVNNDLERAYEDSLKLVTVLSVIIFWFIKSHCLTDEWHHEFAVQPERRRQDHRLSGRGIRDHVHPLSVADHRAFQPGHQIRLRAHRKDVPLDRPGAGFGLADLRCHE
jgi:hypothetical protein